MQTISRLAHEYGLSRSTLLYYDSIGLLCPSGRSPAGYRLYSDADAARLRRIVAMRELGVPLERVRAALDRTEDREVGILLERMLAINAEIDRLRDQQHAIFCLIETDGSLRNIKPRLHLLRDFGRALGVTDNTSAAVHAAFERASPDLHRRFLSYLGFTPKEIASLLRRTRNA